MGAPTRATASNRPSSTGSTGTRPAQFWSFQPPKMPALPEVKNAAWVKTPIDRFILAKLEAEKLQPVRPAGKRELIRRATFDLTGLPPTPEEVEAFLKDESPDAFAKVIDRLLAVAALRRALGPLLARRRPLCRGPGPHLRRQAEHQRLPLSRLGHQRLQRRHAVRPLRQAADRRRPDREGRSGPRQAPAGPRLLRPGRAVLQEHRRRQGRRRRTGRPRRHPDARLPRA